MMLEQLSLYAKNFDPWLWNLIILVAALVCAFLIRLLTVFAARLYRRRQRYSFLRSVMYHIGTSLNHFIPLLLISAALPAMVLGGRTERLLGKLLEIALTISFAMLLINAIKVVQEYVYYRYDLNKADNLRERKIRTQLQFIRKVVVGIVLLLALSAILLSFDSVRRIGAGLLTGVGIGGIIIGFAAQRSLGNLLAGLQIAFTQPIRIDDVLVVEGEWGKVEEITLTYVVLKIWDQRRLILPINYFIEKPFQNWTRISADITGAVFIYTDYDIPVGEIRKEATGFIAGSALWDRRVCAVQVTDAKETAIEIRILMSSVSSSANFDLRCAVREHMIDFIKTNYPGSLPKSRIIVPEQGRRVS